MNAAGINREGFAALLVVREGQEGAVRDAVRALGPGEEGPFARLPGTLFARLVLIPRLRDRPERELSQLPFCLFFAAEFEGPTERWLEALRASSSDHLERIFGLCAGYPGAALPTAFTSWMLDGRVPAGFSVHGYPQLGCEQVGQSLALRERIIAFALETRRLEPVALAERWAREDWEGAVPAP